ncbi:hypothetical protein ACFSC6_10700 [Rufibacter sediminis]|uniref:Uncharacterized protein n=1 Tax=Rufibacter sediminis TaxID=2762756 RepID=A0ABR6VQ80_9BACT|nr:hypothetical protein [Rufibacter sediminis]MBC3539003.1 hypothetical protein [Rufibacter sediminis]
MELNTGYGYDDLPKEGQGKDNKPKDHPIFLVLPPLDDARHILPTVLQKCYVLFFRVRYG